MAPLPAWRKAAPGAINAFAAAYLRMYSERAERNPDADWLKSMVASSRAWTDYRGITVK
ncbi:hypothetical protein [Streptomyces sp. NPDC004629]|uniref:hypothetical protein n=1 Tax=Streptomyces sp. NPDC004629 TaxID=3364705 RepID=UPI003699303D